MAKFLAYRITEGKLKLENVPERLKPAVAEILGISQNTSKTQN